MKKLSFAAGVAAIALAVTAILPAAGVFANSISNTSPNDDFTGDPITLRRTITNVTNHVTNTFGYTITNTAKPTGSTVTGAPSSASIVFNNASPTSGSVAGTTTLDFWSPDYSEVGDYEFTVTESSSSNLANYPIDAAHNSYKVLVQVRYYVDPTTNVPVNNRYTGYAVIYNNADPATKVGEATWTSGSSYTYAEATAKTTGNMADASECFAYTVDIATTAPVSSGDTFTIESSTSCTGGATSVTAGTPAIIYLKNGDTVKIGQNNGTNELPVGASYTITDTNGSDGYTTKMDNVAQNSVNKTAVATTDGTFSTNNTTAIENNKQSDPLTGIITNFWFYIMLLVAGLIGFFIISRRRQDDEEQQQA